MKPKSNPYRLELLRKQAEAAAKRARKLLPVVPRVVITPKRPK